MTTLMFSSTQPVRQAWVSRENSTIFFRNGDAESIAPPPAVESPGPPLEHFDGVCDDLPCGFHMRLTFRFKGRDFRLTDVGGRVIQEILA